MKRLSTLLLVALFSLPLFAAEWKDAPVIDIQCSTKAKANPDAHTKACAMRCSKSGFGIYTPDGQFLKFDANGNQKMIDALQKSNQNDHLRVDVKGEQSGDTIKVDSLSLT